nr:nucleic acid-binding, OB-fold protein [Tanacetum cinerariifolium]
MIELDGATSMRKASVKSGGFVRYPFQLISLGSIKLKDNKYLIVRMRYLLARLLSIPTTLRLTKELWKTCLFRLGIERTIVKIDDTRSQKEWNFPSCEGEKCKKGVVRKNGRFWCQVCKKAIDYPIL